MSHRIQLAVRFTTAMMILGFGVAFPKAQFATTVTWIGVTFSIHPLSVIASIPEEKITEIKGLLLEMLSCNVVTLKDLRSFAGKLMNIASFLQFGDHSFHGSGAPCLPTRRRMPR